MSAREPESKCDPAAPLVGVRVIEIASYVAAPAAGALLADLGAEVIKVEAPEGEVLRHTRPRMMGFHSDFAGSPQFEMENRGKRSLKLDLRREVAHSVLLRLIESADIVLTNLLPERRRKYGLDEEALCSAKPSLIYASLTGYGTRGDDADRPAFDYTAYWARSGMMDLTRDASAIPAVQRPGVGDHSAALSLVCGILAALRTRDAVGTGQVVEVSLLQTGLYLQGNDLSQALATGQPAPIHDRAAPRNPLWNHYLTSDERWLMLVMIESGRYWGAFLQAIGRPELEHDPRFTGPVERYREARVLVQILDEVFACRSLNEWEARLNEQRLIWAPMRELLETRDDPQIRAMGYFATVQHPELGEFETVGPPLHLSQHAMPADQPAPALGADSEAILRELGLAEEDITAILAR